MVVETANFHMKNISGQFIVIDPSINRSVRPGHLTASPEKGDILVHKYQEEGEEMTEFYEIRKVNEGGSFQLVEIQAEPDLPIAGELKDKPNFNSGVSSEPRWPRW